MRIVPTECRAGTGGLESLESRTLLSGPPASFGSEGDPPARGEIVYVESNNPEPGRNAVIALRRDPANGALQEIGIFSTRGTGFGNLTQGLGPDDSDQEVIASADGRFLFAVNQGSDSIAV